jgi:predicted dehydrogenase
MRAVTGGSGPVVVGVVGAGVISDEYLRNLTAFRDVRVVYVADLDGSRAAERAAEHGVAESGDLTGLLQRADVEVVVNLTVPSAHADVTRAALRAGKNVWVEKPFATTRREGQDLLEEAEVLGLRLAGAPDTFLGPGFQTALRTLREGTVGTPLSAFACTQGPGPERWHPNPGFLYEVGAGPLFDMGPYYLTALVQLLGPIEAVTARSSTSREVRVISEGPNAGATFPVRVPTHLTGIIDFRSGAFAQVVLSFDSPIRRSGILELNGTLGALTIPDPNTFDGDHVAWLHAAEEPPPTPPDPPLGWRRGLGVLDLARSMRCGTPERASGALAYHVLDAMVGLAESAVDRVPVPVQSTISVAESLPPRWDPSEATL